MQDVRYDARVPSRVHLLQAASEQVEALQFDHSSNGNGNGAPPEDPTLRGCSIATLSVHGGERAGRPRVYDSLTTPIVQARIHSWVTTSSTSGQCYQFPLPWQPYRISLATGKTVTGVGLA